MELEDLGGDRREAGSGKPLETVWDETGVPTRMPLHMRALEPRILLDAAAVETAEDAMVEAVHGPLADAYLEHEFRPLAPPPEIERDEAPGPADASSNAIAFIAADVADIETIIAQLASDTEIVLLSNDEDGVARIAQTLADRTGLDAVHIVSHGSAGELRLGTATLDAISMGGTHAAQLATIGASLADTGDILLYGCNFAQGDAGAAAAQELADLTGADVAASDDATGHASLGGDWALERAIGAIDTDAIDAGDDWHGLLDETFEQQGGQRNSVDNDEAIGSDRIVGQTFRHDIPSIENTTVYTLERVEVFLRVPNGAPGQDITLSIRSSLNGSDLVSRTISSSQLAGRYEWIDFAFDTPPTLIDGQSYVIVLETDSDSKTVEWGTRNGDRYDRGTFIKDDGAPEPDSDAMFRVKGVYGTPPPLNAAPEFTSFGGAATADLTLDENRTYITTVTARDDDAGDTLSYRLLDTLESDLFEIDAVTGDLSFIDAPDFENVSAPSTDNRYDVVVRVSDGNGGTSEQTIQVRVIDANDAPVIVDDAATSNIDVFENTTAVSTVVANDQDAGATVTYAVETTGESALFTIDPATGDLSFKVAPDFENPSSPSVDNAYDVIVIADDGLGAIDAQLITVTVRDVVEGPVLRSHDGAATVTLDRAENTTAVTTVSATSTQAGSSITYHIDGGADAALFAVDETTGDLSFINAPDFEAPVGPGADQAYQVRVEARDGLGGLAGQLFDITVQDANDAPRITSGNGTVATTLMVQENTVAAGTITASDQDVGDTPRFSIVGGADQAMFTIDTTTGDLSFITAPDFENPADAARDNGYGVRVAVTDSAGASDERLYRVIVRDVNEAPDVGGADALTTTEDTRITGSATLSDPDTGDTVTAMLGAGAANGTATVEPDGTFTYTPARDFEGTDAFEIVATDTGGLADTLRVTVTVRGQNDAPVISATSLTLSEDTSASAGATITDPDTGDTYVASVSTQPENGTASVTVGGAYTYVPNANFFGTDSFVLTVTDADGATDTVTVDVSVSAVNDAPVALGGGKSGVAGAPTKLSASDFAFDDDEGDGLSSVTLSAFDLAGGTLVHSGNVPVREGATLTVAQLATLVFTPGSDTDASAATFAYTANDATAGVAPATIRIDIAAASPPEREPKPEPEPVPTFIAPPAAPAEPDAEEAEEEADDEDDAALLIATDAIEQPDAPTAQPSVAAPPRAVVNAQGGDVAAVAPPADPNLDVPLSTPAPLPVRETVIEPSQAPVQVNRAGITFTPVDQQSLAQDIDRTGEDMRDYDEFLGVAADKVSFAFGSLLSVGGVSFALRGGVLAAALMSAVPAWNRFDPISIVRREGEDDDEPAETLADTMRAAIEDARSRVKEAA